MSQDKERCYAGMMAKVYNWLVEYQNTNEGAWFVFCTAKRVPQYVFSGRGGGDKPNMTFNVECILQHNRYQGSSITFFLDDDYSHVKRVQFSISVMDDDEKNKKLPAYVSLAKKIGLTSRGKAGGKSPSTTIAADLDETGIKKYIFNWLTSKSQFFNNASLSKYQLVKKDVMRENDEHIKGLVDKGVLEKMSDGTIEVPKDAEFKITELKDEDQEEPMKTIDEQVENLKSKVEKWHNVVLTGAPGTGKTFRAKKTALELVGYDAKGWEDALKDGRVGFCQFHPSYDYTDFVEGLRPNPVGDGQIGFRRMDGVFKAFCQQAAKDRNRKYVFIIDEINRGDISKIFGELFYSIDPGYRGEVGRIKTQYQNLVIKKAIIKVAGEDTEIDDPFYDGFYVPENVYVIGTMNDIDRSVESMDFAIRRRFLWVEVPADPKALDDILKGIDSDVCEEAKRRMAHLNAAITNDAEHGLGSAYAVGPAYFKGIKNNNDFPCLWKEKIEPLLREYLRGTPSEKMEAAISNFRKAYQNDSDDEKPMPGAESSQP